MTISEVFWSDRPEPAIGSSIEMTKWIRHAGSFCATCGARLYHSETEWATAYTVVGVEEVA